MAELIQSLIAWYLRSLQAGGFPLVLLLMAVESSIFPLPSEVVMPPAAHLAWTQGIDFFGAKLAGWSGQLALVVAGAIGSWIGAKVMYWFSRVAGRPIVMRFGKYVFISEHKVEGAERWAETYGPFGIFASRLLPVVRHLIGIPAGIVRLDYATFSVYTLVGSALWSAVLCGLGVQVGADVGKGEMHRVTIVLVAFLAIVGALYWAFVHRHMRAASKAG